MAEEGGLEKKVKAAPTGGGSIFDSIGKSIDDLVGAVRTIPKVLKEVAYYTYYTAKAALGLAAGFAMGGSHALILPVGIAAGTFLSNLKNKQKTTFKQMANEVAVGGFLGGLLHYIFLGSRYLISAVKNAYGTIAGMLTGAGCAIAQMPPFLAAHEYLNRALISDYKPQPVNIVKKLKGPMKWLIPPLIANFTVVPAYLGEAYQMPTAAGISVAYGILKGDKKEEKKEAQAQVPAGYGLPQSAYQPT